MESINRSRDIPTQLVQLGQHEQAWMEDVMDRLSAIPDIEVDPEQVQAFMTYVIDGNLDQVEDKYPNPTYIMEWADRTRRRVNSFIVETDAETLREEYEEAIKCIFPEG